MNSEVAMNREPREIVYGRMSHFILFLCGMVLFVPGCSGPTEVDRDNRRMLDAILTAITMKNGNWLEEDAELAEKRHAAGQLTGAEFDELQSIIEKARTGDWKTAEQQCYEFRKRHPFVRDGQ